MISAPFGGECHRAGLQPDMHATELVMIAVDHQVDPRARPDLEAIEAWRQALLGEPQHRGAEAGRAPGFVRLRRAVEPRAKRGVVPAAAAGAPRTAKRRFGERSVNTVRPQWSA